LGLKPYLTSFIFQFKIGIGFNNEKKSDCWEKLEGGRISEIEKLGDRLEYLLIEFQKKKKIKKLLYPLYLMVLSSSNLSTGHVAFRYQ
jgi:hypothetical protein